MIKLKIINETTELSGGGKHKLILNRGNRYKLLIESGGTKFETDITSSIHTSLTIMMKHDGATADFELSSGEKFENICVVGESI